LALKVSGKTRTTDMTTYIQKRTDKPVVQARRLSHATLETPDLDRQIAYYTEINGLALVARETDKAFFASRIGPLIVSLERGPEARLTRMAFEVAPDSDFADMGMQLAAAGIKSEIRTDATPGVSSKVLTLDDPKGTAIDLFAGCGFLGHNHPVTGAGPYKLGHIAFHCVDPQAITEFYCRVLGFRVSDWIEDFFSFLRCGVDHHTVNFVKGKSNKMHHIAFELKDWPHMQNACELFAQRDVPVIWGPGRHGVGHNLFTYHRNPDDQIVEFYAELDQLKDEELGYFDPRPWHKDTPQRPKVWNRGDASIHFGPPPTADFIRSRDD
jgi:catechol 2,3-dioxygenase-like lactoylglutathione lyase family enzyme